MGTPQAVLFKEHLIELPSGTVDVRLRKLTGRDQKIAGIQHDPEKDPAAYGSELLRLSVIVPKSITVETPVGIPAFTQEAFLDLDLDDLNYLQQAVNALNGMADGKRKEYKFSF